MALTRAVLLLARAIHVFFAVEPVVRILAVLLNDARTIAALFLSLLVTYVMVYLLIRVCVCVCVYACARTRRYSTVQSQQYTLRYSDDVS